MRRELIGEGRHFGRLFGRVRCDGIIPLATLRTGAKSPRHVMNFSARPPAYSILLPLVDGHIPWVSLHASSIFPPPKYGIFPTRMLKLEDLQVDTHVVGVEPSGQVKVLFLRQKAGPDAVDVTYELLSGQVLKKTLFRADEASPQRRERCTVFPSTPSPKPSSWLPRRPASSWRTSSTP